ncbi:MAG: hypothetical protein H3C68_07075 [Deltaproteobacteria bacterium]|nr:hypothetical protein [Deltaproteobacteria bacterium]MBZ0219483.1 hypothetical protein [Deltaproteobacteria bacterium]
MKDRAAAAIIRFMDKNVVSYRIDASDRIVEASDSWDVFAVENKASQLTKKEVLGRFLWDFIEGSDTRHLFRLMLSKARDTLSAMRIPFRCDSPETKRFMEMEIRPHPDDSIDFVCTTLKTETRTPVAFIDPDVDRSNEWRTICSWCKRIKMPNGEWVELDDGIRKLDLFGTKKPPRMSHGICPEDQERAFREIENAGKAKRKAA